MNRAAWLSRGGVILLALAVLSVSVHAGQEPLRITLVKSGGPDSKGKELYFEPPGRVIEMVSRPLRLLIEVKNISSSSTEARGDDETSYMFEITDESGAVTIMKRKKAIGAQSSAQVYKYLNADEVLIIPIEIDQEKWENVPQFAYGKKQTFKIRVIYQKHNERPVYSLPYTWIISLGSLTN